MVIEHVRLLTLLGQAPAALEAGTGVLAEVVGDQHAELCLRLAEAAIVARRWGEADRFIERAGRAGDAQALVLAADSAFGAGDLRRAADLAATAARRAGHEARWETMCRALTTLGRCAMRHDAASARVAYARASQTGAEHGLIPARVTALLGLGAVELLDHAATPAPVEARELARRTGLLAEVIWSELLLADSVITAEGPQAAQGLAQSAAERAGRLRLPGLEGMAKVFVAMGHAVAGDTPGMQAVLAGAVDRPPRSPPWHRRPADCAICSPATCEPRPRCSTTACGY
ncbi:hypothetical protein Aple_072400 [Acrocarpospora pleiomorpha]|uniref:MalT-like TPR region domain-containing protein n=1 Tax=Acrocarpospora pleiomorpha TaxID=90975 RepID=A0A5M3XXS3_9ACTN|nr:hypothetical protein [Acrocarpospora pleiomorpha]GES24341.1 hypothetical protein Aple_072400 [Acrocarpospora pleiomorpha]